MTYKKRVIASIDKKGIFTVINNKIYCGACKVLPDNISFQIIIDGNKGSRGPFGVSVARKLLRGDITKGIQLIDS